MMNDQQLAALRDELRDDAYTGLSSDAAFALLNEPQRIDMERTIAVPLTLEGVLTVLSQETAQKLATNPNLTDIRDKMLAADTAGVALWVGLLAKADILSAEEIAAMQGALAATQTVTETTYKPPRIARKFRLDGAVVSMPNIVDRADFDLAWSGK